MTFEVRGFRRAACTPGRCSTSREASTLPSTTTFLSHLTSGEHIVCIGDVYGGTYELLASNLPGLGVETTFLLADDVGQLNDAFTGHTKMVFFETPTNPNLDIIDICVVARTDRQQGALTVVDNTFATPVNQNPLALGADFSIAASLGGVESLVTQSITTTHHGMTAEERCRRGIVAGLVRLSCGLEDADDLVADLRQAFG